jgi:tRNA dimethylallyltransferase
MPKMPEVKPLPITVILGPTASGKTSLSIKLAKKINGEIISADSRQVYRGLDLGTGKVTKKEMSGIKHYLLDVADPKKVFSVTDYVELADKAIVEIHNRGKTPIIVGGTGFYIQALVDGLILPEVPPNTELRKDLIKKDISELQEILKKLDKKRYITIDKNNPHRLIRAIEIATALGEVPRLQKNSKYDPTFIGIEISMDELRKKIHARLISRIEAGMIDEVKKLHKEGLPWKRMEQLGLEYRYLSRFLQNKITKEEMLTELETAICQYAKRQMTWFKRDKRIKWLNPEVAPQ